MRFKITLKQYAFVIIIISVLTALSFTIDKASEKRIKQKNDRTVSNSSGLLFHDTDQGMSYIPIKNWKKEKTNDGITKYISPDQNEFLPSVVLLQKEPFQQSIKKACEEFRDATRNEPIVVSVGEIMIYKTFNEMQVCRFKTITEVEGHKLDGVFFLGGYDQTYRRFILFYGQGKGGDTNFEPLVKEMIETIQFDN